MRPNGTVGALVAIAVGAVLTFALHWSVSGVSIRTVGVIVMLAGAAALAVVLVRSVSGAQRDRGPRVPRAPRASRADSSPPRSRSSQP